MNRRQFIEGLRRALSGKVEIETIEDTVRYYEDYIDIQMRQGKSEEEVLNSLGNPALIAKSIVNANSGKNHSTQENSNIYEYENSQRYSRSKFGDKGVRFIMNMPGWLAIVLVGIILLIVFSMVFSIVSFLVPFIIPIVIVAFILHLFLKKK